MAHLATTRRRSSQRARGQELTLDLARRRGWPEWWLLVPLALGGLGLWEALVRLGVVSAFYFPAPSAIAGGLVSLVTSGELGTHLRASVSRLIPGLLLGAVPGWILGLTMGWSRRLRGVLDPVVAAAHPIPKIAILPLIMVIFGIGNASKIIVIAIAAFFPLLINTMVGVRQISPTYFEVAEIYGAGLLRTMLKVVLPGSLPFALSGLRIALNLALLLTIAVEIVAGKDGLGAMIWLSWEVLRVEQIYASLLVIASLGITFNLLVQTLSKRLAPWQPDYDRWRR